MRRAIATAFGFMLLAGCTAATPGAEGPRSTETGRESVVVGSNTVGERCTQQSDSTRSASVYCGTWEQPSARISRGPPASADTLSELATRSDWRTELNNRFICNDPVRTALLGSQPSVIMQCTRRVGGWPHVAMVTVVGGTAWYLDGVSASVPVMARSLAIMTGQSSGGEAASRLPGADALLATRLAAQATKSGDIGEYEHLMAAGTRANLASSPVAAERAFRAALTLQQKALGANNPNTADPMMLVALQLSNQGQYAHAEPLFDQAERLARNSADPAAIPRLQHYRGLHELNQNHPDRAMTYLDRAETGYTALVPPGVLAGRGTASPPRIAATFGSLSDMLPGSGAAGRSGRAILAARHHRGATQPRHRLQGGRPAGRSRGLADFGGRSVAGQQSVAADRDLPPLSHPGDARRYPRATGFGHDAAVAVLELIHPGVARLPLVRDHRAAAGAGAVAHLRAGGSVAGLSRRAAADARASGRDRRRGAHAVSARLRRRGRAPAGTGAGAAGRDVRGGATGAEQCHQPANLPVQRTPSGRRTRSRRRRRRSASSRTRYRTSPTSIASAPNLPRCDLGRSLHASTPRIWPAVSPPPNRSRQRPTPPCRPPRRGMASSCSRSLRCRRCWTPCVRTRRSSPSCWAIPKAGRLPCGPGASRWRTSTAARRAPRRWSSASAEPSSSPLPAHCRTSMSAPRRSFIPSR